MSLRAEALRFALRGRVLLDEVSLRVASGCVHVLLGPNGAGKSTLLRLLAGDLRAGSGAATLDERPLAAWDALALARRRAVMMQREHLPFPFTAAEVVALGRLPWQRDGRRADERAWIAEALAMAGASALASRRYPQLSGGERARVQFARALAQIIEPAAAPRYLLLDEPTASLDFAFQHECLATLHRLSRDGVGVLAILQDPNLALRYADTVSLLDHGRIVADGTPEEVLTPERLHAVYGLAMTRVGSGAGQWLLPSLPPV